MIDKKEVANLGNCVSSDQALRQHRRKNRVVVSSLRTAHSQAKKREPEKARPQIGQDEEVGILVK